jgi:hypothetical protein
VVHSRIAAAGNDVYVVWDDKRNGLEDVLFNRSTDNGATWQLAPTRLDTDAAGAAVSGQPRIAVNGQDVFVVWTDERFAFGHFEVRMNHSGDGGATWQSSDVLVAGSPPLAWAAAPDVAVNGTHAFVTYAVIDPPTFFSDIELRAFDLSTQSLGPAQLLSATGNALSQSRYVPAIAVAGANVYVAWEDGRHGPSQVYFKRSKDNGATWYGECSPYHDVMLDTGVWPGTGGSGGILVGASANHVYVSYGSVGPGRSGIFFSHSSNHGASFQDGPDPGDVMFVRSVDGGASWSTPLRVNRDPGTHGQFQPSIAVKPDGRIDVVWLDRRADPADWLVEVYMATSLNGGLSFPVETKVSDVASGPPPVRSPGCGAPSNQWEWMGEYIGIDVDGSHAYVVWTDTRPSASFPAGDMNVFLDKVPNPLRRLRRMTVTPTVGF